MLYLQILSKKFYLSGSYLIRQMILSYGVFKWIMLMIGSLTTHSFPQAIRNKWQGDQA